MARHETLKPPAPDVAGQWTAHCLDWDLVTQGDSEEHAWEMLREAVEMVVANDQEHGRNPFDRKRAPQKYWEQAQRVEQRDAQPGSVVKSFPAPALTL